MLLDFNPFGPVTDSLLFTWDELEGESLYTTPAGDNPSGTQVFNLFYAPNFEKVGRAYCFRLVCVSVCLSVCLCVGASVNF